MKYTFSLITLILSLSVFGNFASAQTPDPEEIEITNSVEDCGQGSRGLISAEFSAYYYHSLSKIIIQSASVEPFTANVISNGVIITFGISDENGQLELFLPEMEGECILVIESMSSVWRGYFS